MKSLAVVVSRRRQRWEVDKPGARIDREQGMDDKVASVEALLEGE